jgi:hypothetical protein
MPGIFAFAGIFALASLLLASLPLDTVDVAAFIGILLRLDGKQAPVSYELTHFGSQKC